MTAILEARNLHKQFGAVTAANDICASINQHSVVGLIGTNGAGKTTFVNMVTGYLKPSSGSILFAGRDITSLAPRDITRLGIARSFQIPQLYDTLTVHDNLVIALGIVLRNGKPSWFSKLPAQVPGHNATLEEVVETLLGKFNLLDYRDREARILPQGVRKQLDIAMAMAAKPQVLLLDEPTSGVAAEEKFGIMDMIMNAVRAEKVTVLFVEHDMDIVAKYSDRVLAFYDGRIIADQAPQDALNNADVQRYVTGKRHA
ncbi:MAG: ABC transporter ATP-binding protein [Burkholderiales bacterium]